MSTKYLASSESSMFCKINSPFKNLQGDIVVLQEDGMNRTKWHFGKIVTVYSGKDGVVRVVDVKT